jgi:hypothetical protein
MLSAGSDASYESLTCVALRYGCPQPVQIPSASSDAFSQLGTQMMARCKHWCRVTSATTIARTTHTGQVYVTLSAMRNCSQTSCEYWTCRSVGRNHIDFSESAQGGAHVPDPVHVPSIPDTSDTTRRTTKWSLKLEVFELPVTTSHGSPRFRPHGGHAGIRAEQTTFFNRSILSNNYN